MDVYLDYYTQCITLYLSFAHSPHSTSSPVTFQTDLALLAERYDTKSNVKLGGFRSQFQVSFMSSHTEELWYNEKDCLWMTIYIYVCVCVCVCDKSEKVDKSNTYNRFSSNISFFVQKKTFSFRSSPLN